MQAYKLGDLHNFIMEKEIMCPSYAYNLPEWQRGFKVGAYVAKNEHSLIALRYEGYTKELERMLTAVGVHENILAQIQKEYLL